MITRTLLVALTLASAGCALSTEPSGAGVATQQAGAVAGVELRMDRSQYVRGDTARIVLRNRSQGPIGYNLCHSARERRVGNGWQRLAPLRLCAAVLHTLPTNMETSVRDSITAEWEPGEYRLVTPVEALGTGGRGEVLTLPFTVTR